MTRPPRTAILYEFTERIDPSTLRDHAGAANSFNTTPIHRPAMEPVNQNPDLPDFEIEQWNRLAGWANEPNSSKSNRPTQNAPTNPSHPVWRAIYTALNNQIGVQAMWHYEEELQTIQSAAQRLSSTNELTQVVNFAGQDALTREVPVPVTMTEINL